MRGFLKRILDKYLSLGENSVKLLLFNVIVGAAGIGGVMSVIVSAFSGMPMLQILLAALLEVFVLVVLIVANKSKRLDVAGTMLILFVSLIVFPVMFFTGGGIQSGMPAWFVLELVFCFLLLEGRYFVVSLIIQLVSILVCYLVAIVHPYMVTSLPQDSGIWDSLQAVIVTALAIGSVFRFQIYMYTQSQKTLKESNERLMESEKIAVEASNAKTDFLANMSHEIRTPMNAILGMNELILRETDNPEIISYANNIQSAGTALLSIINDVLDISKIEAREMELNDESYSLDELITGSYSFVSDRVNKKGLKYYLQCQEDLPKGLSGDASKIRQVLINILTNAVKYTNEGEIRFEISGRKCDDTVSLCFKVVDTGIGMRAEDLNQLFDKFTRFDMKKNRHVEGTGLGLAITKDLVDLMGGTIDVQSTYGIGSIFTITIPQKIVSEEPIGNINEKMKPQKPGKTEYKQLFEAPEARILVVDDVELNLQLFVQLVKRTQVIVDTANSGEACLELTRQHRYNVIFMDYMMPVMDGQETLKAVRSQQDGLNVDTPMIMLSANVSTEVRSGFSEMGFAEYLSKPVRGDKLESMIYNYVK